MNASLFFKRNFCILMAVSIIAIALSTTNAIAAAGVLDPTFGLNGIAVADLGSSSDSGKGLALQRDGKIIMKASAQGQAPVLMRYNSNGSVDSSFGASGKVVIGNSACDFAIQSDGKVVAAGSSGRNTITLVRYLGNGTLDNSFGTNGTATLFIGSDFQIWCDAIAIQPDHKIVVFGSEITSQSNHTDFFFARFNEDGTQDAINFIDKYYFPTSQFNYGEGVAVQPDGKIILSGGMQDYEGDGQISVARLKPDGSVDTTFGTNGKGTVIAAVSNFFSYKSSLALQTDGKIVVVGTANVNYDNPNENLAVTRFNTNGTLDTTFGGTGIVITDFGTHEFGSDVAFQSDGKIIIVGTSSTSTASSLLIVRYNKDGSLDNTFGSNGKLTSNFGSASNAGAGIEVQADGKAVVVGASNGNAILARYNTSASTTVQSTFTFKSADAYDGWILESVEYSNKGGSLDKIASTINVGDDARDRQYRGILSFNTISIPDNALIISAQVKIKKQGLVGTDAFKTHGKLLLDIRGGTFSNSLVLQLEDFSALASAGSSQESFSESALNWYTASLSNANLGFINKVGLTQFRLLFSKDDNDDLGEDYIKFFSGNTIAANQPQLIVTYSVSSGGVSSVGISSSEMNINNFPPAITSNGGKTTANINIPENTTAVTTVTAADADQPVQTITYSILGGADSKFFNINSSTGRLVFISAPNYEAPADVGLDNTYNVTVQAFDGALAVTQGIAVAVRPVNDNDPVITSVGNISIPENTAAVTTVTSTDADLPAQPLTYSIVGGADSTVFNIDPSTGELSFISAPDFEIPADAGTDNVYNVAIRVSDGALVSTQGMTVTVSAVNDNDPVITSTDNLSISENSTAVTIVTAADADLPAQTLIYSIISGVDSDHFTIDPDTGELSFITAPDYELPNDFDSDNVYNVTVQASDGTLNVTQDMSVTVTPENDSNLVFTSQDNFLILENTETIAAITAADTEHPNQPLTYSISGGVDASWFSIDRASGELKFITAPDFEIATDSNLDNVYEVVVEVSNGSYNNTQNISIQVTNTDS
jgi:uncharacterized delta-60 repeat protein